MTKTNKDGWIRHRGGKCPVEKGTMVDVRHRDGEIYSGAYALDSVGAIETNWLHDTPHKASGEIMAWRPHKPEQVTSEQSLDVEMPSAKYFDGPLQWRDRILEIDAASKEEEARHCAAMAAYDEERTSLVAKLKAEGFVLIQSDGPNSMEESAQQDIAQQDMSDPANWRVGDIFAIGESMKDDHEFAEGTIVRLTSFDDGAGEYIGTFEYQDGRDYWFCRKESVKWHSRPTN